MKFTLSWLKDFLDTNATADEIGLALTSLGLEVESIDNPGAALKPFTVALIENAVPHPNADKLRVCTVKTGTDTRQVVCGAPNARAGIKVVLADIGNVIPTNDLVIKKSKIRDVESNGMLCSARELGLGMDGDGIIELAADAPIGASIVDVMGLDDSLFDIAITANRADCLGIQGVARDLAAKGIGTLKALPAVVEPKGAASSVGVSIAHDGCKHFVGALIRGVKNGPSPEWLQKRLESVGLRPISMLVDITNYFTIAYGRPLHVFDAGKLKGNLTVRPAKAGEVLNALNNKSYNLTEGMLTIADDSGVLALGGIIGGIESSVTETTTDIFLEAAWFEPESITKTARALQIESDARHRFERGVDPGFTREGALRAIALVTELGGGTASALVEAGSAPIVARTVPFSADAINGYAGTSFDAKSIEQSLTKLGFTIEGGQATPPSWRADVHGIADLAEEVLRLQGYEHIPSTPLPPISAVAEPILTPLQKRVGQVRRLLAGRGGMETYGWSFLSTELAEAFGGGSPTLKLQNPISADLSDMRPNLLPHLLQAASANARRGMGDLALFEVGLQWKDASPTGQQYVATLLRTGLARAKGIHRPERNADVFDAKADAFAIIAQCGLPTANLTLSQNDLPSWYHPGRAARILLGKQVVGTFGEIHPRIRKLLELDAPAVACEIYLEAMAYPKPKGTSRPKLVVSDHQSSTRDFAFLMPADKPAEELLSAIRKAEKQLLQSVELFDLYQGKGVPEGEKSVAIRIILQAPDRSLSEEDITRISQSVIGQAAAVGAKLRA